MKTWKGLVVFIYFDQVSAISFGILQNWNLMNCDSPQINKTEHFTFFEEVLTFLGLIIHY